MAQLADARISRTRFAPPGKNGPGMREDGLVLLPQRAGIARGLRAGEVVIDLVSVDVPDEPLPSGGKPDPFEDVGIERQLNGVVLLGFCEVLGALGAGPGLDVAGKIAVAFTAQEIRNAQQFVGSNPPGVDQGVPPAHRLARV